MAYTVETTGQQDRGAGPSGPHPTDRVNVEVFRYGSTMLFVEDVSLRAAQAFAERAVRNRDDLYVRVTTPVSSRDYWKD